jgi:hypothetical protein
LFGQFPGLDGEGAGPNDFLNTYFQGSFLPSLAYEAPAGHATRDETQRARLKRRQTGRLRSSTAATNPVRHRRELLSEASPDDRLLADLQTPNDVEVAMRINSLEVIQVATTTTDHHQQAAPTGVVLFVGPKVFGQPVDPGRQNGDLDFRGTGVRLASLVRPNQLLLPLFGNSHLLPQLLYLGRPGMLPSEAPSSHRVCWNFQRFVTTVNY